MSKPVVMWVREKKLQMWLPWANRHVLRDLESEGVLRVCVGWPMRGDVWRRHPGGPRWYLVSKFEELFCTNEPNEPLSINDNDNGTSGA